MTITKMKAHDNASDFLSEFFHQLSKTRMSKHCPNGFTFDVTPLEKHDQCEVLGEDNSIILLWGEAGALVFKVHYNLDVISPYVASSLMKDSENLTRETIRAYMNEYLNLYAGYFRGILESQNLVFGMSLPFHTRGEDEKIFFKLRDNRFKFYKWKLIDQNGNSFYCTCEIMPINSPDIYKVQDALLSDLEKDGSSEIDGEIQFF